MSQKTTVIDPDKIPALAEFSPELAARRTVEMRPTNIAGQYGFRVRCLSDQTGDARLALIGAKYADCYALGIAGVRAERLLAVVDGTPNRDGFTAARISALGWLRAAKEAIGGYECWVIEQATVECVSASDLGRAMRVTHKTAAKALMKYLTALADWDEKPRIPKKLICETPSEYGKDGYNFTAWCE